MNIPLTWLSEYVKLPASQSELTDRLTMIGHMLDKTIKIGDETIIDLELRGNRSDLFGLIGIARDIGAAYNTPLKLPETKALPKTDPDSDLVVSEAANLVERFIAVPMTVKVGPSPKWLVKKLEHFGLPSINNVVDITNYVMIETGEPMHAYDQEKLKAGRLIIRKARKNEKFTTLLGTTVTLNASDLAICDEQDIVGLTMIGGKNSGISNTTTSIILEAAVYNQANVRRTARRLSIRTEAGTRHEKHLDPNQIPFALERAYKLLADLADAKPTGSTCDIYPTKHLPITIEYQPSEINRLIGIDIPVDKQTRILESLDFKTSIINHQSSIIKVTVPTFRTDIDQSADLVEEVARIYGYDQVPRTPLSGELPEPATPKHIILEEKIRDIMQSMQVNEVITSSLISNTSVADFQTAGEFPTTISLINPPDQTAATLRPSLVPNLVFYSIRNLSSRNKRVIFFEIGKTYHKSKTLGYKEDTMLGIILASSSKNIGYSKLKGIVEGLLTNLGIDAQISKSNHPSMDSQICAQFTTQKGHKLATLGLLDSKIKKQLDISTDLFVAEISLSALEKSPQSAPKPYILASKFQPIIEDLTFTLPEETPIGKIIESINKLSLVEEIMLKDRYKQNFTFTIIYRHPEKQLSTEDITPLRKKLVASVEKDFGAKLIGQI